MIGASGAMDGDAIPAVRAAGWTGHEVVRRIDRTIRGTLKAVSESA
jgi:hypothetical protein